MDEQVPLKRTVAVWLAALAAGFSFAVCAHAQTPEQQRLWDAQEAQARAAEKARAEKLNQEREARRSDPMAWVHSLDPMSAGGWEFSAVAGDGSWAVFITDHQLKRSGQIMSVWLRQEFAEPQKSMEGEAYFSEVRRLEFDCAKDRARATAVIYYSGNNLTGNQHEVPIDSQQSPWSPIVPGTQNESDFRWACTPERVKSAK